MNQFNSLQEQQEFYNTVQLVTTFGTPIDTHIVRFGRKAICIKTYIYSEYTFVGIWNNGELLGFHEVTETYKQDL